MAINLDNLDSDLEFVALKVEGSERGYEVVLSNVFYVEDILNILFHNPKGVIKYNDTPFKTSDLNDGAEFVTRWFAAHAHKLDLNFTVVDHNVTISSNDWQRTLKVLQTYNDESEVKALAERSDGVISSDHAVAESQESLTDWDHFVNAFNNDVNKYGCWMCMFTTDACVNCAYDRMGYDRFKHFRTRLHG